MGVVIGTIFKIIGCALLGLLLLVLLLLALVLFVPIRYQLRGTFEKEPEGKAVFSWLFHLVQVSFVYEQGEAKRKIRIFGILQTGKLRTFLRRMFHRGSASVGDDSGKEKTASKSRHSKKVKLPEKDGAELRERKDADFAESSEAENASEDKPSLFARIAAFMGMLRQKVSDLRLLLSEIWKSYEGIKERIEAFAGLWEAEETVESIGLVKEQLMVLLMELRPLKGSVSLHYGTGDPATTGYITAALGIIYGKMNGALEVQPDFLETVFEGRFWMKGRLRIFTLVRILLKLYFNPSFRVTMEQLGY